jgi:hypothetical protein
VLVPLTVGVLTSLASWEGLWWAHRRSRRTTVYEYAKAYARRLGRPLVVIGAPEGGMTAGYGCGDYTIDLVASTCPNSIQADITKRLPFPDNSVVVFTSCVLEYVNNAGDAISEIARISGGHMFFVGVEPFTLTSLFYRGAKRSLPIEYR